MRASTRAGAPTTGLSFLAAKGGGGTDSESDAVPPDSTGAVGPSNIVVPLNGRIKVFDRAGNAQYSATLDDFFSIVAPGSDRLTDPRVEYDAITKRWFVIAINVNDARANNRILIATSHGPNVQNGESAFAFDAIFPHQINPGDLGEFADYPTLATDAQSILIGLNNFNGGAGNFNSTSLLVIDKSDLLEGTLSVSGFPDLALASAGGMFTPHGADNDDPSATESYVIGVDNLDFSVLDFRRVTYPGGVPTLSPQVQFAVPATRGPSSVPALGSTLPLDAIDDRLFEAMVMRAPTGEPRLWTAHSVGVDATGSSASPCTACRTGSRWYELGNLTGVPTVLQAGTLFDSAALNPDRYWFPTIAANGQGHAVIGSSVAGPNRFAGVALAQRFAGDPPGSLGPVSFAQPGVAAYNHELPGAGITRQRWGDYSQVSIDPTDNMTFWTFQEYTAGVDQWGVRVIEVKAPPPATPTSSAPTTVPAGLASVNVVLTGTPADGSGFYDPGPAFEKRLAASVSGGVTVNGVSISDPTHLTLNLNTAGASPGAKIVTVTNPDGQSRSGAALQLVPPASGTPSPTGQRAAALKKCKKKKKSKKARKKCKKRAGRLPV